MRLKAWSSRKADIMDRVVGARAMYGRTCILDSNLPRIDGSQHHHHFFTVALHWFSLTSYLLDFTLS